MPEPNEPTRLGVPEEPSERDGSAGSSEELTLPNGRADHEEPAGRQSPDVEPEQPDAEPPGNAPRGEGAPRSEDPPRGGAAERSETGPVDGPRRFTPETPSGTRRMWNAMIRRPDIGHVGVGLLVALLGFAAVVQVRSDDDDALAHARRDDLVQILDGLRRQGDRLDDHVTELEADRRDLISGADTEEEALAQARERARVTGILAGTVPATGPGIIMTISDPDHRVNSVLMFQAINELRDAGAEAIQITGDGNDASVRVVASTAFENPESDVLHIGGQRVDPPYQIIALGDPGVLSGSMSFAKGIVSRIENQDAQATVTEYNELTVDVLHEPKPHQYARPAPEGGNG